MNIPHRLIFLFVVLVAIAGCNSGKKLVDINEDFDNFYDLFHLDEEFQMSRIVFPLGGSSEDANGRREWTRDNWVTMKVKIYDVDLSSYKVEWNKTEDSFTQKFWLEGTGFGAEYKFKRIEGKWYLVYAQDTNL